MVTAVIAFLISFFDGIISSGKARGDNPGLVLVAGLPRLPGAPRASLPACGDACGAWPQTSTEIKSQSRNRGDKSGLKLTPKLRAEPQPR